jgi:hypothetical protein
MSTPLDQAEDYQWYNMAHNIGNMAIKGRKGKKYLSLELRVPLDPFLEGEEDLNKLTGRLIWGIKKDQLKNN